MSTIKRPKLHFTLHESKCKKRNREEDSPKNFEEQIWNSSDGYTSNDDSDFSVYSDEEEDSFFE